MFEARATARATANGGRRRLGSRSASTADLLRGRTPLDHHVTDSPFKLRVEREDGELLVLAGLELVRGFIAGDPSAKPGGYDALAGKGDPGRITVDDIQTINISMRARSEHARWQPIFDNDQSWLSGIPLDLDLIETDDDEWAKSNGAALVSRAIGSCIRPYIALARATKVLHLKRPRLFPVLDELVVEVMGVNLPGDAKPEGRIEVAARVTDAIRREGRRNIKALRRIQDELNNDGVQLSLVRILDITLWFSHTAAGVPGALREISIGLRSK